MEGMRSSSTDLGAVRATNKVVNGWSRIPVASGRGSLERDKMPFFLRRQKKLRGCGTARSGRAGKRKRWERHSCAGLEMPGNQSRPPETAVSFTEETLDVHTGPAPWPLRILGRTRDLGTGGNADN